MPWSYVAGKRASKSRPSSRVRVYERDDVPGRIFMTKAWIKTESGRPEERVLSPEYTREKAEILADLTAKKREMRIVEGAEREKRRPRQVRLGDLIERYHDSKTADDWKESYAKDQETLRRFWLQELGADQVVDAERPSPAVVERIAREASKRKGWSPRTEEKYLKYIHAVVRWGKRKAAIYRHNPLEGMDTPSYEQDTSELIYTLEELRSLAEPHPEVDWRLTLAVNIAYDTGRRRNAIRHLRQEDLEVEDERLYLHFRAQYDKGGKSQWVAVSARTALLIADALERKRVKAHGWLLPGGHLEAKGFWDQPLSPDALNVMLREAEETLGTEHVDGRGFHGIKRRHVTEMFEVAGGNVEDVKDTTGNVDSAILRQIYRKRDRAKTAPHVDALDRRLSPENGPEDTREDTRSAPEKGSDQGEGS